MTKNQGFTLVELVVTLAILGLLSALITANVSHIFAKERLLRIQSDIVLLESAANQYLSTAANHLAINAEIDQQTLIEKAFLSKELQPPISGYCYQITLYDQRPSAQVVMTDGQGIYQQKDFVADSQSPFFKP